MTEEFQPGQEHSEDTMFQDAVAALRKGDKPRAKELLTLLLKADQNNPTYWIWLSASVDNSKERIYCLQTALKLDPENKTAKRGLILLGALAPDAALQPFTVPHPRAWEEKLLLANEKPREKGLKAVMRSPALRLAGIGVLFAGLAAVLFVAFIIPRQTTIVPTKTNTPGPTPTFTATPTLLGGVGEPTQSSFGPTPLWMLLPETYTPTPVYVNTPHGGASGAFYRAAQKAFLEKDWEAYLTNMQYIATYEPDAADIQYYIGEAYRLQGNGKEAIKAYNAALKMDDKFGPAYLGLALARLLDEPGADVEFLFNEAIERDPDYGEVYLELARYHLSRKDVKPALAALDKAVKLLPNSAEVYVTYARAHMAAGDNKKALAAAEKAYAADITALSVYQLLGELYIESGQYQRAIEALDVYATYVPEDAESLAFLGRAYFEMENYEKAVENFDKAFEVNRNSLRKYYLYRGLANLELGNADQAVEDLEQAAAADARNFDVNFGLARAYYAQEKFGSAFQRIEPARAFAKTDEEISQMLYWRALIQEKRDQRNDAVKDWQALLAMKSDAVTKEMRATAEEHLKSIVTPTNTPKGGNKTATPTAAPSRTPTPKGGAKTTPTATANGTTAPTARATITPPPPTVTMTPPPAKATPTGTPTLKP